MTFQVLRFCLRLKVRHISMYDNLHVHNPYRLIDKIPAEMIKQYH